MSAPVAAPADVHAVESLQTLRVHKLPERIAIFNGNIVAKIDGATPEFRETTHLFLDLPAFGPLSYLQPGVPSGKLSDNADVSVALTRAALDAISLKQRTFLGSVASGDVSISGNPLKLGELFGLLDEFSPGFEVVEPKKAAVE